MDLPHCKNCGTPCIVDARYCRKCGMALFLQEDSPEQPAEGFKVQSIAARDYYNLEPCDCDKVKYVPSEINPNFLRKA